MSASAHSSDRAEPNLTPILDMVFQLITFFMLVINFKSASMDLDLALPVIGSARPVDTGGQEELLILNIDKENKRISLGLKQIQPDPWTTVAQRYPMGSRVTGKVVRLTDFGAFVELEPGVDGLLHISQMAHRPITRPDEIVNVGDELGLLVIRVDPHERRIGLSLKELGHAMPPPDFDEGSRGGGGRRRKGKQRTEYDYDDEN